MKDLTKKQYKQTLKEIYKTQNEILDLVPLSRQNEVKHKIRNILKLEQIIDVEDGLMMWVK